MIKYMERNRKNLLLCFMILFQFSFVICQDCTVLPEKDFFCYNDYNINVTCFWNSELLTNTECTIHTKIIQIIPISNYIKPYNASCDLKPVHASEPAKQKCSLIFKKTYKFLEDTQLQLNLSCIHLNKILTYQPICHIKLNPPGKPSVNITTVSWLNQVEKHMKIENYKSQLQWKQKHQSWTDPSVQKSTIQKQCKLACEAQLDFDLLVEGGKYEARVRVMHNENYPNGTWSDWSPIESWISSIGTAKHLPISQTTTDNVIMETEIPEKFSSITAVGLAVFVLLTILILFKTNKTTWIYIVKRISGPAIPNPGKAAELQTWLSPNFTKEFFCSHLKPVEILSVEVTARVDAVTPYRMDVQMKAGNLKPTSSSFDNPTYSHLCTPTGSSVSTDGVETCTFDMPSAPVCVKDESNNSEFMDTVVQKKTAILDLFFKGTTTGDSSMVISDYEMVEKLQLERHRLHSADSGMCSYEEFSQESLEVDSMNMKDFHNKNSSDNRGEEEHHQRKLDFQKLFGGCGDVLSEQAIQVCPDYERLPNMQMDSPELPSLESGVGSVGEEYESQERFEENDKSTNTTYFLFPSDSATTLPLPDVFTCSGLKPHSQPLLNSSITEKLALISERQLTEFTEDDDYLPVRQDQS